MRVSVIVPCYNEENSITELLEAIQNQDFPSGDMEVIISDGLSTDRTRERISFFSEKNPDLKIKVVDNHKQTIPSGLNQAIRAAEGEFIVRMDAHSNPEPEYIRRCINALENGSGENVGGVINILPANNSWMAISIATAAGHPLGVGDARYRIGSEAGEVDTVAFGAYRASLVNEIGYFDENLLANEDYEFNVRIRQAGKKIWLDPRIRANYIARKSLKELAVQYWRYGFWKLRMLIRYPETLRWRQIAGFFVLSWIILGLLSIWFPIARWFLAAEAVIYSSALIIAGAASISADKPLLVGIGVPLAIATMHFSWGSGFLYSLISYSFDKIFRKP